MYTYLSCQPVRPDARRSQRNRPRLMEAWSCTTEGLVSALGGGAGPACRGGRGCAAVPRIRANRRKKRLAVVLGHVAEAATGLGVDRPAAPAHLAPVRLQHPEHDPHGGGLAGAVRADKPEHLPFPNGERHVVEGDEVAVAAAQPLQLEHVIRPSSPPPLPIPPAAHLTSGPGRCRRPVVGCWGRPRVGGGAGLSSPASPSSAAGARFAGPGRARRSGPRSTARPGSPAGRPPPAASPARRPAPATGTGRRRPRSGTGR